MPYDEAVAAFLNKIEEEIKLDGATKWRTSDEEQKWSGLGINTHAMWTVRFQKDIAFGLDREHDKTTDPHSVLHRWKKRCQVSGSRLQDPAFDLTPDT